MMELRLLSCLFLCIVQYSHAFDRPILDDGPLDPFEEDFDELEITTKFSPKRRNAITRSKRSFGQGDGNGNRDLACEMLIAIDEPLFKHFREDIKNVTNLATDLVDQMNEIYSRTILRGNFNRLYFRIKEIRILFEFCTECNETQRVYLTEFSKTDYSDFCLAHVFTYRDFPEGVQGLAWKGTICRSRFNTGFTTLLNHQISATRKDSAMTLAHEVGHNLGSDHDEDIGCNSAYIMSKSGSSHVNPQFSSCSTEKITEHLNKVLYTDSDCFVEKLASDPPDFSFCGNGIVEGDEECDCGLSYLTCDDPCCYAAHIHWRDLENNRSATPCRRNAKLICLQPFQSTWTFAFIVPWIFILIVAALGSIGLVYDWNNRKILYRHVTDPAEMIRSETSEQIEKRIKRQSSRGQNVYIIREPLNGFPTNHPPPPPTLNNRTANPQSGPSSRFLPEQPHVGLVEQMKKKLERKN